MSEQKFLSSFEKKEKKKKQKNPVVIGRQTQTGLSGLSGQTSLSTFLGANEANGLSEKLSEKEERVVLTDKKPVKKLKSVHQIETDYYDKSRIENCAKILRERFNVSIDIRDVRYGSKPPINEKIYGYYMFITIRSGDRSRIIEFIENECKIKVD